LFVAEGEAIIDSICDLRFSMLARSWASKPVFLPRQNLIVGLGEEAELESTDYDYVYDYD